MSNQWDANEISDLSNLYNSKTYIRIGLSSSIKPDMHLHHFIFKICDGSFHRHQRGGFKPLHLMMARAARDSLVLKSRHWCSSILEALIPSTFELFASSNLDWGMIFECSKRERDISLSVSASSNIVDCGL